MSSSTKPTTGNNTAPPTEVERITAKMRDLIAEHGAYRAYIYATVLLRTDDHEDITDAEFRTRARNTLAGMDQAFADLAREQAERIAALRAELIDESGVTR